MSPTQQPQSTGRIRAAIGEQVVPCTDQPNLFFDPEGELPRGREMREQAARTLCLSCPARQLCHELAQLERPAYGIWGGFTADEIRYQQQHAA